MLHCCSSLVSVLVSLQNYSSLLFSWFYLISLLCSRYLVWDCSLYQESANAIRRIRTLFYNNQAETGSNNLIIPSFSVIFCQTMNVGRWYSIFWKFEAVYEIFVVKDWYIFSKNMHLKSDCIFKAVFVLKYSLRNSLSIWYCKSVLKIVWK